MALEPLEQAQRRVLDAAAVLPAIEIELHEAHGLVLAENIEAEEQVPPFSNTAMDGYAVVAADTERAAADQPVHLAVVGELPAGAAPDRVVSSGEAIRIMTGAPMPDGADAVVPVEQTSNPSDDVVAILAEASPGAHVRSAGGDVDVGDVVFTPGTALGPAHLGVLASLGVEKVRVHRRPRVGVISTGDELVARGPLAPGQIRDSNRPLLRALVAEAGAEVVDLGIVADEEAAVRRALTSGIEQCDALVTSGGVSVGDYDYVKAVLEELAAERGGSFRWSQVAIRPAKPFAFGTIGPVCVFGLPGNPVSSHVSFELFARPALRRMAGYQVIQRPRVRARAVSPFGRRPDGKLHLDRVIVSLREGSLQAERCGKQASNVLSGMAAANGLALVPDGEGIAAGEPVEVMVLSDLLGASIAR